MHMSLCPAVWSPGLHGCVFVRNASSCLSSCSASFETAFLQATDSGCQGTGVQQPHRGRKGQRHAGLAQGSDA